MARALILVFLLLISTPLVAQEGRQSQSVLPSSGVEQLHWMSGHWTDGETEEQWSMPAGDTLLGFNRTVKDGKTVHFEFMRIEQDDQGIVLWASPKGQATTAFRLSKSEAHKVTFENPEHDFPKKVVYKRVGDTLKATVSAGETTLEWSWKLVP